MRGILAVGVVAALAWAAAPVGADAPKSLGEVAAKDKDKKKPAKVYTEDDLRNPKGTGTVSKPAAEGTTAPAAGTDAKKDGDKPAAGDKVAGEKPKTEDELHAAAEKEWRDKLTQAQADVTTWTGEVNRLQSALNDTSGPLYGPGRAAKADALENAKRQLATATQSVADLQEQGRRNRYH
jgi:hypothetical protein